jgi:spermidine synthase
VAPYQTYISCFAVPWGFLVASKGSDPRKQTAQEVDQLIASRIKGELGYWDSQTHAHAFSLPKHIRRALEKQDRVITDKHPLIVA